MNIIRYFLILAFIAIGIITSAQDGTFTKVFSSSSYDEGIAAFRMPNKTYRLIANTGDWGWGSNNIWYIALDTNANFMWHKTLGYGGIDIANAATADEHGNIYIIGSSTSESANSYQMLYIALDSAGSTITKKYFGGTDWDFGNGITLLNDTTLALVGETYSYAKKQSDAWLQKIKLNGDVIFSTTVGANKKEAFYAVTEDHSGNLIAVGNSQSYGNGSYDATLYHFNSMGDSISLIIKKDTTDACFLDVVVGSDSAYFAAGYQRDTTDSYEDFLMHKYTKDHILHWDESLMSQKQEARYNALEFKGPNIMAFGKSSKYGGNGDNLFCNYLQNNTAYWLNGFGVGGSGDESVYSVNKDTSSGNEFYLLIGSTTSYDLVQSGVVFVRMDKDFDFDDNVIVDMPSAISGNNNIDFNISVYPNPVVDKLLLNKPENALNKDINISVYDVSGKCIYESIWTKNSSDNFSINTSQWANGTYNIITEINNKSQSYIVVKTNP